MRAARRAGQRTVSLLVTVVLAGCGASASSAATLTPSPSATPTPAPTPTVEPTPSEALPSLPPGSENLSVVPCLTAQPANVPACLDTAANGETPARTAPLKIGQSTTIAVRIQNNGTTAMPAVTLVLLTFEQPMYASFLKPTACNGCHLHENAGLWAGAEWDNLAPGTHLFEVTIKAISAPKDGRDSSGAYQWLCAMYALPYAQAGAGPIDTSQAFALATAATAINP